MGKLKEESKQWLDSITYDIGISREDLSKHKQKIIILIVAIISSITALLTLLETNGIGLDDFFPINLFFSILAWIILSYAQIIVAHPRPKHIVYLEHLKAERLTKKPLYPSDFVAGVFFLILEVSSIVSFLFIWNNQDSGILKLIFLGGLLLGVFLSFTAGYMLLRRSFFKQMNLKRSVLMIASQEDATKGIGKAMKKQTKFYVFLFPIMAIFLFLYTWDSYRSPVYLSISISFFLLAISVIQLFSYIDKMLECRDSFMSFQDLRDWILTHDPTENQIRQYYCAIREPIMVGRDEILNCVEKGIEVLLDDKKGSQV